MTGKGNFTGSASAGWEIVEKAMTVTAENVQAEYDGKAYGITVQVTDPAKGAAVKYGKTAGTYDLDESPTMTEPGTLTVYYRVTAANYTDYTGVATVTITGKGAEETVKITTDDFDLVLPASMKTVSESAMEGIAAKSVYVGDNCTKIQKKAFAKCKNLTTVRLPQNCTITAGAFDGCNKLETVIAPAGGTAETWARENGYTFMAEQR